MPLFYEDSNVDDYISNSNASQQMFIFDCVQAVIENPMFMKIAGIKEHNPSKWKQSDKDRWEKKLQESDYQNKLRFNVTHIPLIDLFLVSLGSGTAFRTYPVIKNFASAYPSIVYETILGESFKPMLTFNVIERFIREQQINVFTGYLKYSKRWSEESEVMVLFEFPYTMGTDDETYKAFDFIVDRQLIGPYPSDLAGVLTDEYDMEGYTTTEYKNTTGIKVSTQS